MISYLEVNRTLATLRKAEFGFLGVIVEKLTDKLPLLPLYKTVHENFTSYGFSFNSFEVGHFCFSSIPFLHYENLIRQFSCFNMNDSIYSIFFVTK